MKTNQKLTQRIAELEAALTGLMDQLQIAYEQNPEAFAEFANEVGTPEFGAAFRSAKQALAGKGE